MKLIRNFEFPAKTKMLISQELFMIGLSKRYGCDPWLMDFGATYPMMTFDPIFAHLPIIAHASKVGHGDLIT